MRNGQNFQQHGKKSKFFFGLSFPFHRRFRFRFRGRSVRPSDDAACVTTEQICEKRRTCDGAVDDSAVLQLERHRLVRELHQKADKLHPTVTHTHTHRDRDGVCVCVRRRERERERGRRVSERERESNHTTFFHTLNDRIT